MGDFDGKLCIHHFHVDFIQIMLNEKYIVQEQHMLITIN